MDTKATVKIGEYSRGGSTRGDRIPPLRGVRGVFVLEVLTHNTPPTPQMHIGSMCRLGEKLSKC